MFTKNQLHKKGYTAHIKVFKKNNNALKECLNLKNRKKKNKIEFMSFFF